MKALAALPLAALLAMGPALATAPSAGTHAAPQAAAIHWKYKLADAVVTTTGADGKPVHSLNVGVIDYFLDVIAGHVDAYPEQFGSEDQKTDVTDKLRRLATLLTELDEGGSVDANILRREAFAYDLAYKLGFPASGPKAQELYQRLLTQAPQDPEANYLYGSFLAGNDVLRPTGIPYLQKAVDLGVKKANFTMGIAYVAMNQDQKGLACLQQYSTDFPNDQRAKNLIAAIKDGSLRKRYHPN